VGGASINTAALAFSIAMRATVYGANMCTIWASRTRVRRQWRWSTAWLRLDQTRG
jgi:hypothetical protein